MKILHVKDDERPGQTKRLLLMREFPDGRRELVDGRTMKTFELDDQGMKTQVLSRLVKVTNYCPKVIPGAVAFADRDPGFLSLLRQRRVQVLKEHQEKMAKARRTGGKGASTPRRKAAAAGTAPAKRSRAKRDVRILPPDSIMEKLRLMVKADARALAESLGFSVPDELKD